MRTTLTSSSMQCNSAEYKNRLVFHWVDWRSSTRARSRIMFRRESLTAMPRVTKKIDNMKLLLAISTFATATFAQYYSNQSAPFQLVVSSTDATLDGALPEACHINALTELLCSSGEGYDPGLANVSTLFYFNSTNDPSDDTGLLFWGFSSTDPDEPDRGKYNAIEYSLQTLI